MLFVKLANFSEKGAIFCSKSVWRRLYISKLLNVFFVRPVLFCGMTDLAHSRRIQSPDYRQIFFADGVTDGISIRYTLRE